MSCGYMIVQNTSIIEIFILFYFLKHKNVSSFLAMGT